MQTKLVVADDDVVEQLDIQQFARLCELLGGAHILG